MNPATILKTALSSILLVMTVFVSAPALAKDGAQYRLKGDYHHQHHQGKHHKQNKIYSRDRYREHHYRHNGHNRHNSHNRSIHQGFGYHRDHGHRHTRHCGHNTYYHNKYYDRHHYKKYKRHHDHYYGKRYYRKSHHSDVAEIVVGSLILGAVVNELTDYDRQATYTNVYHGSSADHVPARRVSEPVEAVEYVEEFLRDSNGRCYSVEKRGGRRILTETDSRRCI